MADIENAFFNIEVDTLDRDCLRFLWIDDINIERVQPVEYRFCRVVFGVNCSPFLLNVTLQYHLDLFIEIEKEFVKKFRDSFYVDYPVSGEQSKKKVMRLYESVSERLAAGRLRLMKWR